jgi:hypothetical protein
MKKRRNSNKIDGIAVQNPVAKFAHQFNKAYIFTDKSKYHRKEKHKRQEASSIIPVGIIEEASCVLAFPVARNCFDY